MSTQGSAQSVLVECALLPPSHAGGQAPRLQSPSQLAVFKASKYTHLFIVNPETGVRLSRDLSQRLLLNTTSSLIVSKIQKQMLNLYRVQTHNVKMNMHIDEGALAQPILKMTNFTFFGRFYG